MALHSLLRTVSFAAASLCAAALLASCAPAQPEGDAAPVDTTAADTVARPAAADSLAPDSAGAARDATGTDTSRVPVQAPVRTAEDRIAEARADSVWDAAGARGVEWRGLGQEPGWYVEIDTARHVVFFGDYGDVQLEAHAAAPVTDAAGAVTFTAGTTAGAMEIRFTRVPCTDVMSGFSFPLTAVVKLAGREYHGCARRLRPAAGR